MKTQLRGQATPPRIVRAGELELDRNTYRVFLSGAEVILTATEFKLLEFFMTRRGVVFSRDQLLDAVWGMDRAVTNRTVDVYILRLRQKIEADPSNPVLIRSVRGFGYSFNKDAVRNRLAGHHSLDLDSAWWRTSMPLTRNRVSSAILVA